MRSRLPTVITPFDADRVEQVAYALGVGPQVVVTGASQARRRDLEPGEIFEVPPGQFAHILTEETLAVPDDCLGLLSMKFGQKVRGLINVSGFHVDPGYSGRLLFAVYNAGPQSILLTRGEPTFLLWMVSLDQSTDLPYPSTRSGWDEITAEDVMKVSGEVATPQALAARLADLEGRVDRHSRAVRWTASTIAGALLAASVVGLGAWAWRQVLGDSGSPADEEAPPATVVANPEG